MKRGICFDLGKVGGQLPHLVILGLDPGMTKFGVLR